MIGCVAHHILGPQPLKSNNWDPLRRNIELRTIFPIFRQHAMWWLVTESLFTTHGFLQDLIDLVGAY